MSSQSSSNKSRKGRPRIPQPLRTLVVQIRGSNRRKPLSIDAILNELQERGIDPLPARGTVHNIIREWEKMPEEIRRREFSFEWQHLEEARIPWEASEWILRCQQQGYQSQLEGVAFALSLDIDVGTIHIIAATFTNRLATWYWRIHLAAPDLISPSDVEPLALLCAAQERMQDIAGKPMDIAMLEEWLALRPDMERRYGVPGAEKRYWSAVDLGFVKNPIPKTREEAVEYVSTMLGRQIESGIFRRPGAEDFYTGPNPVQLWAVLNGITLPTNTPTKTEESGESKEEHHERQSTSESAGQLEPKGRDTTRARRQAPPVV